MILSAARIFQDNMVLQREKPVWVFGEAEPGSKVTVSIQGKSGESVCSDKGKWSVLLPPLKASVSETLTVSSGNEQLVFKNVAAGEVWLAGGQSNMEFHMFYDQDYDAFRTICEDPMIRFYDVPKMASADHEKYYSYKRSGLWRTADPEQIKYFSAAGYYFARTLRADLGVPIGIIGCNWGGSRACCWMDKETLKHCGKVWLEDYEKGLLAISDIEAAREAYFKDPMTDTDKVFDLELRNRMMKGLSLEELEQLFAGFGDGAFATLIGPWHEWHPNGLYENMVKKIMPYTMKGVIYYQGESDEDHPDIYADMMEGLIACWRRGFGDDLPFLITQLAPLGEIIGQGGKYYPQLREQQKEAAERIPGVWCASIGDVGNAYDIHPKEKRPVGERLALLARGHVYGENILCDAPEGASLKRAGNTLRIRFDHAEGGLYISDSRPAPLAVYDSEGTAQDETLYSVSAERDELVLSFENELSADPYRVEFARTPYYEVNVYNMSSIPAFPFVLEETFS